jgi:hypothetical protein
VLFGIVVVYCLFLQGEAALEEAVFCLLLFLLKIGCSLNLENLNSYKGKQALGVEVVFFFVFFFFWGGNLDNWVLFESRESEFLQREASSGSRSSFFFFFLNFSLRKFGKLGALLKSTRSEIFYLQGKKQQLLI